MGQYRPSIQAAPAGQGAPFPVRNAFRYWPELFEPLGTPTA